MKSWLAALLLACPPSLAHDSVPKGEPGVTLTAARKKDLDHHLSRARTHMVEGRLAKARREFEAALAIDPGNAAARAGVGAVDRRLREGGSKLAPQTPVEVEPAP